MNQEKIDFAFPLKAYLAWRTILLLFQIFIQDKIFYSPLSIKISQRIFESWMTYWDAEHYLTIAQQGYQYPEQAFFPMWPILLTIGSYVAPIQIAAQILTIVCGISACIWIYNTAKILESTRIAKYTILLFLAYPGTMFINANYTEGLFITLAAASWYATIKKKYLIAAVLSGVASGTRLAGASLMFLVAAANISAKKKVILVLLSISGLLMYITYLYIEFKQPLYFFTAQSAWIERKNNQITIPLLTPINYILNPEKINPYNQYIDLGFSILALALLVPIYKAYGAGITLYAATILALGLGGGKIMSMTRFISTIIPVFIIIPKITKSRALVLAVGALFFLLQLIGIAKHTSHFWFN